MNSRAALVGLLGLLTVACASTKQYVAIPDQSKILENPEKARIYVVRPVAYAGAVPMKVLDGEVEVGVTGPNAALCWERDPGPADISSHAGNVHHLKLEVQKGMVYYLLQRVRNGFLIARTRLELLTKEAGLARLRQCRLPSKATAPKAESVPPTAKPSSEY